MNNRLKSNFEEAELKESNNCSVLNLSGFSSDGKRPRSKPGDMSPRLQRSSVRRPTLQKSLSTFASRQERYSSIPSQQSSPLLSQKKNARPKTGPLERIDNFYIRHSGDIMCLSDKILKFYRELLTRESSLRSYYKQLADKVYLPMSMS